LLGEIKRMKIFKNYLHFVILTLIIGLFILPFTGSAYFQDNILSDNQVNVFILNDNNDTTPPRTKISLKGNMSEFGIYTGDVEVTLNATDDLSGVNVTYYRISNGELKTYIEPFIVSGHGQHCLTYWSVDNAGNKEDTNCVYIKIDLVPPTILIRGKKLDNNSYEIDPYTTESGSGFYKLEYYIDNIHMCTKYVNESFKWIWTPPGWGFYMLSGILYDRAGHTGYDEVEVYVPRYKADTNQWYLRFLKQFPIFNTLLFLIYR
jgi:hypothetical protein